jgi:hypothetical protein
MVLDIVTGLMNDANARQYPNPECNDFSSSATQFAIDVATRHPKEEVKAKPRPCPFIGFPATRRITHW